MQCRWHCTTSCPLSGSIVLTFNDRHGRKAEISLSRPPKGRREYFPWNQEFLVPPFFQKAALEAARGLTTRPVDGHKSHPFSCTHAPARQRRAGFVAALLPAGFTAAGPDQGIAFAAFIGEQVGVDRRAEARVIQFDRDVFPPLVGAFRPASPDLRS